MSAQPTMMIFHEPDVLEFAADSVHLGVFRVYNAQELMREVHCLENEAIGRRIIAVYDSILEMEEEAKLVAADAGFERRVPE
ncbi:MAG: hypothetical protein QM488_12770 [Rhizobiaceae bacterium]